MDSERRHQLSQNDLANWMLEFYEDTLRPNASLFLLGAVCAVLVVVSVVAYQRTAAANKAAAWQLYNEACSSPNQVAALEGLAAFYTSGEMGATIRFTLAEAYCTNVSTTAGREQPDAVATLEKAIGILDVASRLTTDVTSHGRIAYDRGAVFETLATLRTPPSEDATAEQKAAAVAACTADLENAVAAYTAVVALGANGVYAAAAQSRIDAIDNPIDHNALVAIATMPIPPKATDNGSVLNVDTKAAPEPPKSLDLDKMLE
ncbi:MAG: hypothetical protein ACRC46_03295 [Thermoguttaceae bacterium]